MPLNSDFILHLPRFAPAEDFDWSVYTIKQMCLVGGEGFEPSASGSQSNLKIAVQLFLKSRLFYGALPTELPAHIYLVGRDGLEPSERNTHRFYRPDRFHLRYISP